MLMMHQSGQPLIHQRHAWVCADGWVDGLGVSGEVRKKEKQHSANIFFHPYPIFSTKCFGHKDLSYC